MEQAPRKRIRIRWWHIVIASVLVVGLALVTTVMALRANGRARFLAQVEARHAVGAPATVEDFLARAPVVDTAAQEAWDVWSKRQSAAWRDPGYDPKAWDGWIAGVGERPAAIVATVEAKRAASEPALLLLRKGGLVLSGYGWAVVDLPPGKRRLEQVSAMRLPSLLSVRDLADWLRRDAVLTEDPRQVLADLDALHAALMAKPAVLIDAMIALAVADIRDRAYVELALRGTLSDDARDRWLAEPGQALRCVADAFDGEASSFGGSFYTTLEQSGPWSSVVEVALGGNLAGAIGAPYVWATGLSDVAVLIEVEGGLADRLRGITSAAPPAWADVERRLGVMGRMVMTSLYPCCVTALEADAKERSARLAARILGLARAGGLPGDQDALLAALGDPAALAPAGDHLALRYERLSDARFRLVIDPASPAPNFDEPGKMAERSAKAGTPASTEPLVWNSHLMVELPVPAR